jgi:hypothetical protein
VGACSEVLAREIEATDSQIDRLVFELYGLMEEEVRVVEGKWRPSPAFSQYDQVLRYMCLATL